MARLDENYSKPLDEINVHPRVLKALHLGGFHRVGDVLTSSPDRLLSIGNFGPNSLVELREKLAAASCLPEQGTGQFEGDAWWDAN